MNAAVRKIETKADELKEQLALLFGNYDAPYGSTAETNLAKVTGYMWVCEKKPVSLVRLVVKDFVSGQVKRPASQRAKLPTAEEFAAQLSKREAEGVLGVDATPAMIDAKPFGPLWSAKLFSILLAGPGKPMSRPSAFIASKMAEGGDAGERYRLDYQAANCFPGAKALMERADEKKSATVAAAFQSLSVEMEAVPVDTEMFQTWRNEFTKRGWPWLPNTGRQRVVYFPKGGPNALERLTAPLMRAAGGASELSTISRDRRG